MRRVQGDPPVSEPQFDADHPHASDCRCAKCECDRHPPFGGEPLFDSREFTDEFGNVWRWVNGRAVFVRTRKRSRQ
jgi:hypothetical protein